jgi:hypothetical protein
MVRREPTPAESDLSGQNPAVVASCVRSQKNTGGKECQSMTGAAERKSQV